MPGQSDFSFATNSRAFRDARNSDGIGFVHIEVEICTECGRPHQALKTCVHKRPKRSRFRLHAEMHSQDDVDLMGDVARANGFQDFTDMCRYIVEREREGLVSSISIKLGRTDKIDGHERQPVREGTAY